MLRRSHLFLGITSTFGEYMSLAQGNNTPNRPRIEPGSPDPESDALPTRPVRPHYPNYSKNVIVYGKIAKSHIFESMPFLYSSTFSGYKEVCLASNSNQVYQQNERLAQDC